MNETSMPVTGRFVEPDKVVGHFHLRPGDVVADFGAGSGYFLKALGAAVGEEGRIYACEIQKNLIDTLAEVARKAGLINVDTLWCDLEAPEGSKLGVGVLDAAIVINTLFQFDSKAAALSEIHRVLRSGGKLFIVDWSESFSGLGPQPGQVVDANAARALIETAGFVFDRTFDAGDHHYGLAYRKP